MESIWRKDFPLWQHQPDFAYFDSAASCQTPQPVIDAMAEYMSHQHANVHRGSYTLSHEATLLYEDARAEVAAFINAKAENLAFTRGTTESMNLLADTLPGRKDEEAITSQHNVVVTLAEHHANWLPWQRLCERTGAEFRVIPVDKKGRLEEPYSYIDDNTRIVSMTHASNVMGIVYPVREIFHHARKHGAVTVLDAAQTAAHMPLCAKELNCDAMAFSAHKLYGPTGIGGLWLSDKLRDSLPPWQLGGGIVTRVALDGNDYVKGIQLFEAGTPNLVGAKGFMAAVKYLQAARQKGSTQHIQALYQKLQDTVNAVVSDFPKLYTLPLGEGEIPVICLTTDDEDMHPRDLTMLLDARGIAARTGYHCAHPLVRKLTTQGCMRLSIGMYNSASDIEKLDVALRDAMQMLSD